MAQCTTRCGHSVFRDEGGGLEAFRGLMDFVQLRFCKLGAAVELSLKETDYPSDQRRPCWELRSHTRPILTRRLIALLHQPNRAPGGPQP